MAWPGTPRENLTRTMPFLPWVPLTFPMIALLPFFQDTFCPTSLPAKPSDVIASNWIKHSIEVCDFGPVL
jgi:hypothetical protein